MTIMKKTIICLLCLTAALNVRGADDDDRPVRIDQMPQTAQTFIARHFNGVKVALAKMEKDFFGRTYEVIFTNGNKVEFDGNGRWTEIECKYRGYIQKEKESIAQARKLEDKPLPKDINYLAIEGLRLEARQKLDKIRPANLGQAGRISGVSPFLFLTLTSACAAIRLLPINLFPNPAAKCKGVFPFKRALFTSAPASINRLTMVRFPFMQAMSKGVSPASFVTSIMSGDVESNKRTISD